MDTPQENQSVLDSLRTIAFRLGLKGYNVDEVDEYLEKAAIEAEALQEQVRQLNERLKQASDRIVQLENQLRAAPSASATTTAVVAPSEAQLGDETLQRTLLLAQKFVDQTKRESEVEAQERVARATEQARTTIAQAEEHARRLTTEAEQRLRDEVSRLEAARGQLTTDVENMARHLEAERNRLRGALTDILKWVEENVQPANSLLALRASGASGSTNQPDPQGSPASTTQAGAANSQPGVRPIGTSAAPTGVSAPQVVPQQSSGSSS